MKHLQLFFTLSIVITSAQICLPKPPPRAGAVLPVRDLEVQQQKRFKVVHRTYNQWCDAISNNQKKDVACPPKATVCACMWICPILTCPLAWQAAIEANKATLDYMKKHEYRENYSILPNYAGLLGFIGTLACSVGVGAGLALCTDSIANKIADAIDPIFEEEQEE